MKQIFFKSALVIAVALLLNPGLSFAQGKLELTPFAGYQFGGKLRLYEGEIKLDNAANYGLVLNYEVAKDTKLELFWSQMNTTAQFNPYYGYGNLEVDPFDMNVGYIQIGSVREINMDNIRPFGSFTLGTTYFLPQNTIYEDAWKFSVTLGGGVKIWLSDRVGIRMQGRLMLPMFWSSTGFSVGTGGSGFYVGGGTSLVQGDFTGGLIIALGE
jgi:hypothetical protein